MMQCKRWESRQVGASIVDKMHKLQAYNNIDAMKIVLRRHLKKLSALQKEANYVGEWSVAA
ncbi:hypothetical protein XarjCFBP1022_14650 [Xanthomonas arboricola]|nr:hypothetical protein XarjCFBP1022_14650 [Xanthomonas arboricola]